MNILEIREFVKEKHKNQTRKQGTPYYLHPFAVADILEKMGFDENYQIAALFHDLLEDTDVTYEELINLSNLEIANAVKLLTKKENYIMSNYIEEISQNKMATAIKLADRLHNISEVHLAAPEFRAKYLKETKEWFLELAKDTPFAIKLTELLDDLML